MLSELPSLSHSAPFVPADFKNRSRGYIFIFFERLHLSHFLKHLGTIVFLANATKIRVKGAVIVVYIQLHIWC